jgi:hypothetical protein
MQVYAHEELLGIVEQRRPEEPLIATEVVKVLPAVMLKEVVVEIPVQVMLAATEVAAILEVAGMSAVIAEAPAQVQLQLVQEVEGTMIPAVVVIAVVVMKLVKHLQMQLIMHVQYLMIQDLQ